MISEFREIVLGLKNRRGMFVFDNSYSSLIHYIMGFEESFYLHHKNLPKFQDWFNSKVDKNLSSHWSAYLLKILAEGDQVKAQELTINYMLDYIDTLERL